MTVIGVKSITTFLTVCAAKNRTKFCTPSVELMLMTLSFPLNRPNSECFKFLYISRFK